MENEMEISFKPKSELMGINVQDFIGKKVKIEAYDIKDTQFGKTLILKTEVVDTLNKQSAKPLEIRGSRMFGFQKDKQGNPCIGEGSKLHVFLQKHKVGHFKELIGKEVILQVQTSKKDGNDYLTFA